MSPLPCRSPRWFRNLCRWAAATACTAALAAPVRADSTITVNSSGDGIVIDNELTLREAMILGGWWENDPDGGNPGKVCFTAAEKAQVTGDGAGCFGSPVRCSSDVPTTRSWRRGTSPTTSASASNSGPGFGRFDTDRIAFVPAITTIVLNGVLPSPPRTRSTRPAGGWAVRSLQRRRGLNSGLLLQFVNYGVEPNQIRIRNLEIEGFTGDCIRGVGVRDSEFTNLVLHTCGQNGIRLTWSGRNPSGNKIGGGPGLGNEIREMFEYGIRIEGSAAYPDAPQPNLIQGNRIGWSLADPANALGNSLGGIAIVDSALTEIGSTGAAEVNRISGNGGPGIHLYGPRTQQAEVFGNYIGAIDPAGTSVRSRTAPGSSSRPGADNDIGGADGCAPQRHRRQRWPRYPAWGESDFNTVRGNRMASIRRER